MKPPIDNTLIMLEISPFLQITDKEKNIELYRFQTETTFSFSGLHSRNYINGVVHEIMKVAINEFNIALQQTNSLLVVKRKFELLSFQEVEKYVEELYKIDYCETKGIVPYWKKTNSKTESENDEIISTLPKIPDSKLFKNGITEEQILITKCIKFGCNNETDISKFNSLINFYKTCFNHLKQIDLRILNDKQYEKLKLYLNQALNMKPVISNEVSIENLYRATIICDKFLENGKVRDIKCLTYPPLDVVKENGKFNRASGLEKTVFYATTSDNFAIREIHPKIGKRIIVAKWLNHKNITLNAYPLCITAGIPNDYADKNNYAFEKIKESADPIIAEWMECFCEFYSSEFIKDTEPISIKRYDYIFSALFADTILQDFPKDSALKKFDCIVYPSVAWNHIPDNLAIVPEVVDNNFKIIELIEYEILNTWYNRKISIKQYPAELKFIRKSTNIIDNKIIWSDD